MRIRPGALGWPTMAEPRANSLHSLDSGCGTYKAKCSGGALRIPTIPESIAPWLTLAVETRWMVDTMRITIDIDDEEIRRLRAPLAQQMAAWHTRLTGIGE